MGESVAVVVGEFSCELLCATSGANIAHLPLKDCTRCTGAPLPTRFDLNETWRRGAALFPLPEDPELLLLLLPEAAVAGTLCRGCAETGSGVEAPREAVLDGDSRSGGCCSLSYARNSSRGLRRLLLDLRRRELIITAWGAPTRLVADGEGGQMINGGRGNSQCGDTFQCLAADGGLVGLALLLSSDACALEKPFPEKPHAEGPVHPERHIHPEEFTAVPEATTTRLELHSHPARGVSGVLLRLQLPELAKKSFSAADRPPTADKGKGGWRSTSNDRGGVALSLVGTHALAVLDTRLLLCRLATALPLTPVCTTGHATAVAGLSPSSPLYRHSPRCRRFADWLGLFNTGSATSTLQFAAAIRRAATGGHGSGGVAAFGVHPLEVALAQLFQLLRDGAATAPSWLSEHLGATDLLCRARRFCEAMAAVLQHAEEPRTAIGAHVAIAIAAETSHNAASGSPWKAFCLCASGNTEPLGLLLAEQLVWTTATPQLLIALSAELSGAQAQLVRGATDHLRAAAAIRSQVPTPLGHLHADPQVCSAHVWAASYREHHSEGRRRCTPDLDVQFWNRICTEPMPRDKLRAIVELCDAVVSATCERRGQRSSADELLPSLTDSAARAVLSGHAPQLLAQLQLAAAALSVGCGRSGSCDKARYCFISATIAVRVLITRACKR